MRPTEPHFTAPASANLILKKISRSKFIHEIIGSNRGQPELRVGLRKSNGAGSVPELQGSNHMLLRYAPAEIMGKNGNFGNLWVCGVAMTR